MTQIDNAPEVATADVFAPVAGAENPEFLQLITPAGERVPDAGLDALVADVTDQDLLGMYRDMVVIRAADLEATALQRQGQLGLWASAVGQEGAQTGAGRAVDPNDYVVPTYREHAMAFARGIKPQTLLELYRGVSHCGWDSEAIRTHPYMIVLAAQAPHAVGYAMGLQRDGLVGTGDPDKDAAVLALFGDGSSSEGEVSEAFTWAASFNAPVVFYCQNNQWGISTPTTVQSRVPLYLRSRGWGIPSVRVDGNDVLACLAVTRKALAEARSGQGPRFIEAVTYRMGAHTTSDDPSRYRSHSEEEDWAQRDPILRVRKLLENHGVLDEDGVAAIDHEAKDFALELHEYIHSMPDPDPIHMFDHAYAAPHPRIDEERAWFEQYQQSFADSEEQNS